MKKLFVLVLVLTLLSVMATPALAAGGPPGGNGNGGSGNGGNGSGGGGSEIKKIGKMPFSLAGTITSVDSVTRAVTVTVVSGNTLVKPYISQNLTLQTTDATRFLLRNPDGVATPIAFADLAAGQSVSVNGTLANSIWTATRITVGADLSCLP